MRCKRQKWLRSVPLIALALSALFCSKDYNPFADLTNAKVRVLSWGPKGGGPIELYTTYEMTVVVAVREAVDSFRVSAKGNRFWSDTLISLKERDGGAADAQTYRFSLSFHDTGVMPVTVVSYRSNGEAVPQEHVFFVVNPLRQDSLRGELGKPVRLLTPPVGDRDVRYVWSFDAGRTMVSAACSTKVTLYGSIFQGTGSLIVTDLTGNDTTPPVYFFYSLRDTTPPSITCDNGNRDTIVTADTIFAFRARIADSGSGLGSCTVNGDTFDLGNLNTNSYTKLFTNMQRYTRANGAVTIAVRAWDRAGNGAQHTYYALFDPAGPHDLCQITIVSPSSDIARAWVRDVWIYAAVENSSGGPLTIRCKVNGVFSSVEWPVAAGSGKDLQWHLLLDTAAIIDSVEVGAYTAAGQKIGAATRLIMYAPSAPDDKPPMIWSIGADTGRWTDQRLFTSADSVTLTITAFDDGSGVDSLWVNTIFFKPDSEDGFRWHAKIKSPPHQPNGLPITIHVIDRSKNGKDSTITLFRNSLPVFTSPPQPSASLCIDSTYNIPFNTFDADGDAVKFIISADSTVTATTSGSSLVLRPKQSSLNKNNAVSIQLSDDYEKSSTYYRMTFSGVNCSQPVMAAHLLTGAADFPTLLQADRDTLLVRLSVDTSPPPPGLRYTARFTDLSGAAPLLDHDTSSLIRWAPTLADTGLRRLSVSVGNATASFDSLTAAIAVVRRNQYPCSLSYRFTGAIGTGGELLLSSAKKPETLYVSILDKDDPRVEKYTVTVSRQNMNTVQVLNEKSFFIQILPDSSRALDTLRMSVRDLTGSVDSVRLFIRYAVSNPGGWRYQRMIGLATTAAGAGVSTNVYNFPALVRLTRSTFDFSQARRYGEDLRFTKADSTPIPYEIERFDSVNGLAEVWVKIDTVYRNDDTHYFIMRWGNPAAADAQNSRAVFDTANGFVAVWHLKEGGGAIRYNSAQGNFNATPNNIFKFGGTPALIALGDSLAGNDYCTAGKIEVNKSITLSAWVKPANYTQYGSIVAKEWSPNHIDPYQAYGLVLDSKIPSHCQFTLGINGTQQVAVSTSVIPLNQWTYLSGTWDGSVETAFFNGVSQTRQAAAGTVGTIPATPQTETTIGQNSAVPEERFNGVLDEIRIERVSRSADWIKLCYMNQRGQDALVVFR